MKLMLDTSKPYALALEGGGAKGAYQIGVWRALREAGIRICAVAGTSVGALNAALITMGDLDAAEQIWRSIRYSQVIDVNDEVMSRLMHGQLWGLNLRDALEQVKSVFHNRGFDVTPLLTWMKQVVDEPRIRSADTELFIVTYSLSDREELELRAKDLPEGSLCDMLLASAYLPIFRNEKLGGKRYTDGGLTDVLPLHVLIEHGYTNILAVRLYGVGFNRRVRIPKSVKVTTLVPKEDLGGTLEFDAERSSRNLSIGYYDAQRLLYGLKGKRWYLDAQLTEQDAYALLMRHLELALAGHSISLRQKHEILLPALAKKLDAKEGSYLDLFHRCLEEAAETEGLERFHIYTEAKLMELLAGTETRCPKAIREAIKSTKLVK